MKPRRPIATPPARVRQRHRADGSWRIWWEPETALREAGYQPVELDPARLTWSVREAERLNTAVADARDGRVRRRGADARSVHALIRAYKASPFWDALRPATQKDYGGGFRRIEEKWGVERAADFTKSIVREWYETLYRTSGPSMAASMIRHFSVLMSYAELKGWIEINPCLRLRIAKPKRRSRVATWAEIDALIAAAVELGLPGVGVAVQLSIYQGQRETDVIGAPPGEVAGLVWKLRQSKRGKQVAVDIHQDLLAPLARAIEAAGHRETLIVYEPTGKPYDPEQFGKAFARVRARAAELMVEAGEEPTILTLQFRDLRRSAGHYARLAGASERDVADMLGNTAWTDPELSGTYMPATYETASRAVRAIQRPKEDPK